MGYWKSKVLPKIKKVFEKNGVKKAAAAEATKSFDGSKEEINKDFEEKKTELQPKVLEIYEASSAELKIVVKERTEAGLKKQSTVVNKFLEELVKIEFPGSKLVSEASSKFGPALVSGPVFFVFEKVATFLPVEEPKAAPEAAVAAPTEEAAAAAPAAAAEAEESSTKEKDVVIEEGKKEEAKEEEKTPAVPAAEGTTATPAPEPVKEEAPKA